MKLICPLEAVTPGTVGGGIPFELAWSVPGFTDSIFASDGVVGELSSPQIMYVMLKVILAT